MENCTDSVLQEILARVTDYMLRRLKGEIEPPIEGEEIGKTAYLSPQELNSMVKLLKDNGIRVKLTEADTLADPYAFLDEGLTKEDLEVPDAYKN